MYGVCVGGLCVFVRVRKHISLCVRVIMGPWCSLECLSYALIASAMHLSAAAKADLAAIANKIGTPGKGLLACDESAGTIGLRFADVGAENTEENRRYYRNLLFSMETLPTYISGVILDPETLYQSADTGASFPEYLQSRNIVPGIKPHLKVLLALCFESAAVFRRRIEGVAGTGQLTL